MHFLYYCNEILDYCIFLNKRLTNHILLHNSPPDALLKNVMNVNNNYLKKHIQNYFYCQVVSSNNDSIVY